MLLKKDVGTTAICNGGSVWRISSVIEKFLNNVLMIEKITAGSPFRHVNMSVHVGINQ